MVLCAMTNPILLIKGAHRVCVSGDLIGTVDSQTHKSQKSTTNLQLTTHKNPQSNWEYWTPKLTTHNRPQFTIATAMSTCGSKKGVNLTLKHSVLIPMLPWVAAELSGVGLAPQSKPILGHKRKPLLCASHTKATMSAQFSKKVSKCHPNSNLTCVTP